MTGFGFGFGRVMFNMKFWFLVVDDPKLSYYGLVFG